MAFVMTIPDLVADLHLSAKAAAATAKVRAVYSESMERKEHEQRQEVGMREGCDL